MPFVYRNIKVELFPGAPPPMVHLSENDVGDTLVFELVYKGQPVNIPSGSVVKFKGTKKDGLGFTVNSSNVSGNVVSFVVSQDMTSCSGVVEAEISITLSNNKHGTCNVVLIVKKNPHSDGTQDGSYPQIISEMRQLVNQIEGDAETASNAADTAVAAKNSVLEIQQDIHQYTANSIDDWLDNHPEATTTVQDGSITTVKLASNLASVIANKSNTLILATWHDFLTTMDEYSGSGDARTNRFYTSINGVDFCEIDKDIYPLTIHSGTTDNTVGAPSLVYWGGYFMLVSSSGVTDETHDATIGVSEDLINWTWYDYFLGIRFDNVTPKVLAPELCVLNDNLYIVQSIAVSDNYVQDFIGTGVADTRTYIAQITNFDATDGFTFGTATQLDFYGDDTPNIDATIIYDESAETYYALVKNDYMRCVQSFSSPDLTTWTLLNNHVLWRFSEAPAVCYYGGVYHVYIDSSRKHRGVQKWIYHMTTKDFIIFTAPEPISASCHLTVQHGSVFTLTDKNAIAKLQALDDFSVGGIGESKKTEILTFYTSDIRVDSSDGSTRIMNYVSVCPYTEYQITLERDGIINYLDNVANLDFVRITVIPSVTGGSLTIVNSGVGETYTAINETVTINEYTKEIILYKSSDGLLHLMPIPEFSDGTITAGSNTTLVSYICRKNGNIVQVQARITATADLTSSDVLFIIPDGYRPKESTYATGFVTSGFATVPVSIGTNGNVKLFGSATIASGNSAIYELCYIQA